MMALAAVRADPNWNVVGLVTAVTAGDDRISIHGVRRAILHAQAESIGLPVVEAWLEPTSSNEAYEAAWELALLSANDTLGAVRHVAYGDLFLADVRAYRDALMTRLGYVSMYPLWEQPTATLAHAFIADGYRAVLTCVDTTQIGAEFAGREYDERLLADLPVGADPCGEHGEFHTCVLSGPMLRSPLQVEIGERVLRNDRFQYCDLILT